MNLSKRKQQIKFILISFALLIAISTGAIYLYNRITQSEGVYPDTLAEVEVSTYIQTQLPDIPDRNEDPIYSIAERFTLDTYNLDSVQIFEYTHNASIDDQAANELINNLNLETVTITEDARRGKTIIASRGTEDLVIYQEDGQFYYTNETPATSLVRRISGQENLDQFKQNSELKLAELGIDMNSYSESGIRYLRIGGQHVTAVSSIELSDLIEITYEANVNGIPIIDRKRNVFPNLISVWVDTTGTIKRINAQKIGVVEQPIGNFTLKREDEIIADIQLKRAELINGTYPLHEPIQRVLVNSGQLAYLAVENYIVPVYILEAEVVTTELNSGTGYLIIEAVRR